ncbi:hypothetical protein RD110_08915 [Rhodoferax koreense]|uniref:Cobalt transporter n=1 Tax=Rhodoferax koreensis TaxID=1842727 RepID=A0A1P8JU96_9BURK|nr:CbtA family protein [Rhodoferax koreense]APW37298.1 hypothetical protein RD110_08915 [Rhodoferax koreense]
MLFQRLIWCALAVAVLLGSAQSVLQRFQTVPIILAAEVFEGEKVEPVQATAHEHEAAHEHGAEEWAPAEGLERTGWTWVANVLHAFSMALLALAAMGLWTYRRGANTGAFKLAFAVAASGWLSLHFWPSLGLHAEVPGMDAAALGARQGWWVLAAACAALACGITAFATRVWRFVAAVAFLALPFLVGAPQHTGDALAGFSGAAHAQLEELGRQFIWATTWLSLSFWALMGLLCAVVYARWLKPVLAAPQLEATVA